MEFLSRVYFGNTVQAYIAAGAIFAGISVTVRLLQGAVLRRVRKLAERTENDLDDVVIDTVEHTNYKLVLLVALYAGSLVLTKPLQVKQVSDVVVVIAVLLQLGMWATAAIRSALAHYREHKELTGDTTGIGTMSMLALFARLAVWAVVALLVLDNLGVDVTALVAGLGIGGIAVALALQNILGDLFASVSIMLDKPFEVGDFLIINDYLGTVEKVGIKTTRLRSLGGEQLVFANSDLLNARLRNYKRMYERRAVFSVGVTYQTPADTLEEIPALLRQAIESQEKTRFDRAHFKAFGDSALEYEVVYYLTEPDYNLFMDIQQAVNLQIVREFESRNIEIAYPTRTLFVQKTD